MYVQRNEEGVITGLYAAMQTGYAEEFLPEDSPEIKDFYKRASEIFNG